MSSFISWMHCFHHLLYDFKYIKFTFKVQNIMNTNAGYFFPKWPGGFGKRYLLIFLRAVCYFSCSKIIRFPRKLCYELTYQIGFQRSPPPPHEQWHHPLESTLNPSCPSFFPHPFSDFDSKKQIICFKCTLVNKKKKNITKHLWPMILVALSLELTDTY